MQTSYLFAVILLSLCITVPVTYLFARFYFQKKLQYFFDDWMGFEEYYLEELKREFLGELINIEETVAKIPKVKEEQLAESDTLQSK